MDILLIRIKIRNYILSALNGANTYNQILLCFCKLSTIWAAYFGTHQELQYIWIWIMDMDMDIYIYISI